MGASDGVAGPGLIVHYVREPLQYGGALYSYGGLLSGVYFAYDVLGSMVSRWVGASVEANYYYKAFGEQLNVSNDAVNIDDQLFWNGRSGYYYDSLTGQYSAGRRDYDPVTGRWTQIDRIRGDARGNDLCYVGNNATSWVDPSGMFCEDLCSPEHGSRDVRRGRRYAHETRTGSAARGRFRPVGRGAQPGLDR